MKKGAALSHTLRRYGFNGRDFDSGTGANTYQLHLKNWTGLLLDGANDNPSINLHKTWIDAATIAATLETRGVPRELDFLSNDIDSADLWVLKAVFEGGFRPRVVLAEYNCNYPLEATLTNHPSVPWKGPIYGASLRSFWQLADEFGYVIIDVIAHDVLLLRRDLLRGSDFPSLEHWRPHTRLRMHTGEFVLDRERVATQLVDYNMWKATGGNMTAAQGQAVLDQVDLMQIFLKYDGVGD